MNIHLQINRKNKAAKKTEENETEAKKTEMVLRKHTKKQMLKRKKHSSKRGNTNKKIHLGHESGQNLSMEDQLEDRNMNFSEVNNFKVLFLFLFLIDLTIFIQEQNQERISECNNSNSTHSEEFSTENIILKNTNEDVVKWWIFISHHSYRCWIGQHIEVNLHLNYFKNYLLEDKTKAIKIRFFMVTFCWRKGNERVKQFLWKWQRKW